jgi:hypothetical protein
MNGENFVKEIHVNGEPSKDLHDITRGVNALWRTMDDPIEVVVLFEDVVEISRIEVDFWVTCVPKKLHIYTDREVGRDKMTWAIRATEKAAMVFGVVNPTMRFEGPFPPTSRLQMCFSGGQLDPFYRLYRYGMRRLTISGSKLPKDEEPSQKLSALVPSSTKSLDSLDKLLRVSKKMVSPLYAFPDSRTVFSAIQQRRESPWKLLSYKSRHKQKLEERLKQKDSKPRFLLPRFYPPISNSIPSLEQFNRLHIA